MSNSMLLITFCAKPTEPKKPKRQVIKEFSSKITQDIYIKEAEHGLWPSEKNL